MAFDFYASERKKKPGSKKTKISRGTPGFKSQSRYAITKVSDRFIRCPRQCTQNKHGRPGAKTYDPVKKICSNCGFSMQTS